MNRESFLRDGILQWRDLEAACKMTVVNQCFKELADHEFQDTIFTRFGGQIIRDRPNDRYNFLCTMSRKSVADVLWPAEAIEAALMKRESAAESSAKNQAVKIAEANALLMMGFVRCSHFNAINADHPLQDHYNEAEGYINDALEILRGLK